MPLFKDSLWALALACHAAKIARSKPIMMMLRRLTHIDEKKPKLIEPVAQILRKLGLI
jgi:hypothetical protein